MAMDAVSSYRSTGITATAAKSAASGVGSGFSGASGAERGKAADPYRQLEDYVKLTPAQRMRADLLQQLDLTEERLGAMPPEERQGVEAKLLELVQRQMELGQSSQLSPNKIGSWVDTVA